MELEWQQVGPGTTWPYLWCHLCAKPKLSGILVAPSDTAPYDRQVRICLECLDKLNSFANFYAVRAGG